MQKNEGMSPLQLYTKINSKWINNLNIRVITIKLLEDNLGANLHNLVFGSRFLDMTSKIQTMSNKKKR